MDERLRKLDDLNESLRSPEELSGVFLPKESPKQFDFMFIAEMPSMSILKDISGLGGNFNVSARDKFFQEAMIKYGVAGSYVTDIVKKGDIPRKPTKEEINQWLPFLLKEVAIIRPKAIIVLGKRTYGASFKPFVGPYIPKETKVDWVFHYSSQVPRVKFEQKFAEVIGKIKNNQNLGQS